MIPRFPLIVIYAGILHLTWGVLLISYGPIMTVGIAGFLSLASPAVTGICMILVGAAALLSAFKKLPQRTAIFLLLPQQLFLLLSGAEAISCVFRASYADGVPRPWQFILADQLPAIIVAAMHSLAVAVGPQLTPISEPAK